MTSGYDKEEWSDRVRPSKKTTETEPPNAFQTFAVYTGIGLVGLLGFAFFVVGPGRIISWVDQYQEGKAREEMVIRQRAEKEALEKASKADQPIMTSAQQIIINAEAKKAEPQLAEQSPSLRQ